MNTPVNVFPPLDVDLDNNDVQRHLAHLASEMERYSVIVNRLWGKIYSLHIASLEKGHVNLSRWSRMVTISDLVLTSFYCAWYAFSRDGLYEHIRWKHESVTRAMLDLRIDLPMYPQGQKKVLFLTPNASDQGSDLKGDSVTNIADIPGIVKTFDDPRVTLPAVFLEAILEEALFNAIKYGDLEHPIIVDISIKKHRMYLRVENKINVATKDEHTLGQGKEFLRMLADVCDPVHNDPLQAGSTSDGEKYVLEVVDFPIPG